MRTAKPGHLSLFARVRREAARDGRHLVVFLFTAVMHALGHATLALAAGMCAWSLVHGSVDNDPSFPVPRMPQFFAFGATDGARTTAMSASSWALLGVVAATAKLFGGSVASYLQARGSGAIAGHLRLELLDVWLGTFRVRHSRQMDHGQTDRSRAQSAPFLTPAPSADIANDAGAPARALAAMTADVREVQAGIERGLLGGVRAGLQLVPLVALFAELAPGAAALAALTLVPFAIALGALRRRWTRGHLRATREAARLLEAAEDAVRHADVWVAFGAQSVVRAQVARLGLAIAGRGARLEAAAAAMSGVNELLAALLLLAVFAAEAAGWVVIAPASLVPLLVAFFLAYRPVRELAEARLSWSRAEAAYGALPLDGPGNEQMNTEAEPPGTSDCARSWPLAELEVRALTPRGSGLAPISLRAGAGEIVAVAGRTGSGKTALLRALLGLDPVEGEVFYGGRPLQNAAVGPAARPFSWVPQDAPLLAGSLEENVFLGSTTSTALEMPTPATRQLLAELGAGHLASAVGNDRLGAGGRPLSGGERQWVALARAVATAQPVLLLDEPTSGLDPRAQEEVLRAIGRLRGKRTVLLVTHRPEPLLIADRIVRVGD